MIEFNIQCFANVIHGTNGDDSIEASAANGQRNIAIYAYEGNDYIHFDFLTNTTINAGNGDDTVNIEDSECNIIYGEAGNDYIYYSGLGVSSKNTIYGGEGDDRIDVSKGIALNFIDGGAGNDGITVNNRHSGNTVKGGTDDDIIYIKHSKEAEAGTLYQYEFGDGNDTISGFNTLDDIQIIGSEYSTLQSSNDLIVTMDNGSILLKDAASIESLNIWGTLLSDENGKNISNISSNNTVNGTDYNDTIKSYGDSVEIYSGNGDDSIEVIGYISRRGISGTGNNIIDSGYGNDKIRVIGGYSNTVNGGDGNDLIYISDTTVITILGDQGNDTIISAFRDDYINNAIGFVFVGGIGDDLISVKGGVKPNSPNDETVSNGIYQYSKGDGHDTIFGYDTTDTLQITGGSYSTIVSGDDVIIKVDSGSITLKYAKDINLNIDGTFDSTGGGTDTTPADTLPTGISIKNSIVTASTLFSGNEINLAYYENATKVNASALSQAVTIVGTAANNSLKGGKGADTISGGGGNDTLTGGSGNDIFVYNSGNDFITDYKAGEDKIKLSSGSISSASVSSSNVILNISNGGKITVKGGKDKNITVIDSRGNETTTIYGGISTNTLPTGLSIKSSVLTASTAFTGNKIDLADYPSATKVNASALSRSISIVGTAANNSLKGGKGADTIYGGAGNDTVSLGGGADVYIYSSGNDLIQDYKTGQDKIKLSSGSITSTSISSSNVILNISNGGKITVKGGKNKNIIVIDSSGNETTNIYPLSTLPAGISIKSSVLTASSAFTDTKIDLAHYTDATKVNASALSNGISIVGSSANNSLKGGKGADKLYGGSGNDTLLGGAGADSLFGETGNDLLKGDAGNDTLSGGSGNDTLTGGAGNDVFVYSAGKDIITDYTAGQDKIKISSGTISKTSYSGKNVIFTIGSGSLTVKNGKGKKITITDSSGNTTTKTYSGNVSARTLDLLDDNNFISDDNQLSQITEQKISFTDIQPTNTNSLAQEQTILTFAKEK